MTQEMNPSLYDRVGGEPTIMAAVGILYEKLVSDDTTRSFFEGMEMDALVKKQIAFMAWALGGPSEYRGRDLRVAHAALVQSRGLTDMHFDAVMRHLAATLRDLDLDDATVDEVLRTLAPTRTAVLGR
jgi:hemoglobin